MYNIAERKKNEQQIVIKDYPYSIAVEVSARCNLRCIMCENPTMKREKGDMDFQTFKKIADDAAQYADLRFWINGYGESLLNKEIFDFVSYTKEVGISHTYLNSNAMLLTEEASKRLIEGGLGCLVVSLDGFNKETYERVRVGGNRDKVFNNVSKYLEILNEIGNSNQIVEVQIIEMEETQDEIDQFVDYWTSKGAHVKLKPLLTWGNVKESDVEVPEERLACSFCNMMQIMWDGTVPYCSCGDCELIWKIGNIKNGTIAELWKEKVSKFCSYHINHEFDKLPEFCKACTDWSALFARHLNQNKEEVHT